MSVTPRPVPNPAVERRITERLLAYWERIRKGRLMPTARDIDPDDLSDLWDCCFLVHVRELGNNNYNYAYLGAGIVDAYRAGLTSEDSGGEISLATMNANRLATNYERVIETRKPFVEEGEFQNAQGEVVKYRQCLLPLGQADSVDAIFGGIRFKIFPNS